LRIPESSVAGIDVTRTDESVPEFGLDGQCHRVAGNGGRALARDDDAGDLARCQPNLQLVRDRLGAEDDLHDAVALEQFASQRLAERRRRLGDLFEQEVREVARSMSRVVIGAVTPARLQ
jgi:hypothetical protein